MKYLKIIIESYKTDYKFLIENSRLPIKNGHKFTLYHFYGFHLVIPFGWKSMNETYSKNIGGMLS